MSVSVFLDSNILLYSYSATEIEKQGIAQNVITQNNLFISTQILQEFCNIVTRKFKFSYLQARVAIQESCQNNILHINRESTVIQACSIADRFGYSFYDSMIISAAIESGCSILYSEDLRNGQTLDGKLTIVNPFLMAT